MSEYRIPKTYDERRLLEALCDMVNQHCGVNDADELDSYALSTNADAMHLLAEYGLFLTDREFGRRVIGKLANWNEVEEAWNRRAEPAEE